MDFRGELSVDYPTCSAPSCTTYRRPREEVLTAGKAVTKDPVLLLGPNATETAFKLEPLADFQNRSYRRS